MTTERKLLETSSSELSRALLRAGADERPSRASMHRTVAAIGLGSAVASTASTSAAAGTTAVAKSGATAIVAKIAIGLSVCALAVGGATFVRSRSKSEQNSNAVVVVATSSGSPAVESAAPPLIAPSAPTPVAPPMPSAKPPATLATAAATQAPSLAGELSIVEAARHALAAGNTTSCLASLDKYNRDYPHGAFAQEVSVMRIEAYAKRGDRKTARALAARFLAANPSSPYAARVQSIVRDTSNP